MALTSSLSYNRQGTTLTELNKLMFINVRFGLLMMNRFQELKKKTTTTKKQQLYVNTIKTLDKALLLLEFALCAGTNFIRAA